MTLLLFGVGLALVAVGVVLLRRVRGYRVARVLRAAPEVPIADAVLEATEGRGRYVRVHGRISSDEEFPDENERPLVFRWRRLEVANARGWRILDQERTGVTFGIRDRGDEIGVDSSVLAEGLVVVPRESTGRAHEIAEMLPPDVPRDAIVRHRIDQVSAVEHAVAAGVPEMRERGPVLTAGLGRPLILTTLEVPDAMRLLSGGQRRTVVLAAAMVAAGLAVTAIGLVVELIGLLTRP